jgi:hypothetical protein
MDPTTKRDQKRDSAKKAKDHSVYTQKSIRVREALIEKNKSCPVQGKAKGK